jgi:SAM-dependent methyltransferase
MSTEPETNACPLCGGRNSFAVKGISTALIERHWRKLGYDLRSGVKSVSDTLQKRRCANCDLRFFVPQMIGGPDLYATLGSDAYYGAFKPEFIEVLRMLAKRDPKGSLLEFGCGSGYFLEQAARYFERSVGVDFNEKAVNECQRRNLDARVIEIAELEDQSYDVVATFQVLEHVPNPGETLRQLVRLLRPGGQLIVAVPNEDSLLGDLDSNYLNLPPHHASCWTKATFDHVAKMLSLDLEYYWQEPLDTNLYLAAVHERMDRHLPAPNIVMRLINSVVRRIGVASALANFDAIRAASKGHTHIAVFRRGTAPRQ